MPKLIRLYIVNIAIGVALAVAFTAMLIALDVGHLRHLVLADRMGWVAVLMLVAFHSVLFAGVQFAIAVMSLAEDDGRPGTGRKLLAFLGHRPSMLPAERTAPRR